MYEMLVKIRRYFSKDSKCAANVSKKRQESCATVRIRISRLVKKKLNDLFPNKRENWIVQGVVALCLRRARFKPSKKKRS